MDDYNLEHWARLGVASSLVGQGRALRWSNEEQRKERVFSSRGIPGLPSEQRSDSSAQLA